MGASDHRCTCAAFSIRGPSAPPIEMLEICRNFVVLVVPDLACQQNRNLFISSQTSIGEIRGPEHCVIAAVCFEVIDLRVQVEVTLHDNVLSPESGKHLDRFLLRLLLLLWGPVRIDSHAGPTPDRIFESRQKCSNASSL